MCYWQHQALENPYLHPGEQDITAHVNFSDLIDEGASNAGLMGWFPKVYRTPERNFLVDLGNPRRDAAPGHLAGDAVSMQRLLRMKNLIVPDRMGERFKILVQRKEQSFVRQRQRLV